MIPLLPATQVRKIPLPYYSGIFISYIIYRITAALSRITRYTPIPKYNKSKRKAF